MAWARLALVQAAGEGDIALQKMAEVFGFKPAKQQGTAKPDNQQQDYTLQAIAEPTAPDSKKAASKRPPARFVRVNRNQCLESPDDTPLHYLYDPSMRLQAAAMPKGSYRFNAPRPLLAMPRLLPFLHNGLGQARAVGKLDYRRLTKQIAEAKAFRRLPYQTRQRWPQRLEIIVDTSQALEPYWADFAFIIQQLEKLLGAEAVTSIRFDADSLDAEPPFAIHWPTQDADEFTPWQTPAHDVAILILSDLGETETHPAARIRWQRLLGRLQTHSAPLLTLSPVAKFSTNPPVCRLARPNPLHDQYPLPRHPCRTGYALDEPTAEKLPAILALLSALPVIDPGLLRRLRDDLQWGGSELESQIWNHPDMRQTGLGIRLRETVAESYRNVYQQQFAGTAEAKQLWQTVQAHHAGAFHGLQQLEALNQSLLEGVDSTNVQAYLQQLCATVAQLGRDSPQRNALLLQCRTILASKPESIWHSGFAEVAYALYAMVNEDNIRAGKWPEKLESGFDPSKLQWLLDENAKAARVQWHILQTGGQGQAKFQRAGTPNEVVYTNPIATIEAQPAFPPTLYLSGLNKVIKDGDEYRLEGVLDIRTTVQQLELVLISKPAWAVAIGHDASGLFVETQPQRGERCRYYWHHSLNDQNLSQGFWYPARPAIELPPWASSSNADLYGLYADLSLKDITQRFRWIPPRDFLMGSPDDEPERSYRNPAPVILTEGFWLADTACTQALWQAVMGNNPASYTYSLENPVENVSWDDVREFIVS